MSAPPFNHDTGTALSSLRQQRLSSPASSLEQPAQHTTHLGSSREVARRRKAKKAPSCTVLSWLTCKLAVSAGRLQQQRAASKQSHLGHAVRGAQQQAQAQIVALQAGL